MKRRYVAGMGMVERAQAIEKWRHMVTNAGIHTLMGEDVQELVGGAGSVIFVTLGAAKAQGLDMDSPDISIICGAGNAVADQTRLKEVDPMHRASIASGLAACQRIAPALSQKHVLDAVVQMHFALRTGRAPWMPATTEGTL